MSVKIYRVFVTGLVIQDEDHDDVQHWDQQAILDSLINTNFQFRELKDDQTWPQPATKKRAYTCSICGGRHSARHCPKRYAPPGGSGMTIEQQRAKAQDAAKGAKK